jgi:hypothetical protein
VSHREREKGMIEAGKHIFRGLGKATENLAGK